MPAFFTIAGLGPTGSYKINSSNEFAASTNNFNSLSFASLDVPHTGPHNFGFVTISNLYAADVARWSQ